ncbi:1240_t:CDS:2 [Diversispora eburnea]|uniref:1240_t:CDS:1 n=1 Tax=Diversispora eburnea TaxID=1213867 RepID=A0A9N9AUD5_9GLOM|nr:1240_t:CDS:2 [Diversispora eburnea]
MRLIHASGFNSSERETYRSIVFVNIMQSMRLVLEAMEFFKIPLDDRQPFPILYLEPLKKLWTDSGVQQCYERDRLFSQNYVPSDQDILHTRMKTTGIVETIFHLGQHTYRMFDVGGQRSERKKWIHCFEDVTAVLFLVAISGYDQCLVEDRDANQMQEALMLFDSICNSQWFVNTSMILFLNKIDIFREKIKVSSIRKYFPDYSEIYSHFTDATDTNLLRHIMGSVTDIILTHNLKELVL